MPMLRLSLFVLLGWAGPCLARGSSNGPAGQALKMVSVPLDNYNNLTYITKLMLGTPPQKFLVMLDSAGTTWVPAYYCTQAEPCFEHKMYDWSKSTTQSSDWEDGATPFGRGNVTGYVFRDAHELGGVSLGNLQFVNGIGFPGVPSFVDKPFDGVFGLRLGANSTLYEMAKSGVIGSPKVGLYFSNDMTTPGEALFGGANEQHYQGSMTFMDALDSAFKVHLNGYEVAGQRERLRASWARPAPTEPFIGGPASEIKKINTLLGARKIEDGKYQLQYELHCNARTSDFTFIFGGQEIVLRPEDYVVKVETTTKTTCYSGFIEAEEVANASWHLGLVFLRRVYTVLEAPLEPSGNGRVGFAIAK
uniref:Pseudo-aspartic peptidase n=1 Tax=Rhipicephalus microplus TaxID=6941 RepID=A0A411AQW7_RHIMP|nr:pseudo-aspartic peptidase [Rhipicephalus microplus]